MEQSFELLSDFSIYLAMAAHFAAYDASFGALHRLRQPTQRESPGSKELWATLVPAVFFKDVVLRGRVLEAT